MWRLQTKTTQAAYVNRVAWQPGQGGQLALATDNGGKLIRTGLVKKEIVDFGAGWMHELAWSPAGDLLATVQGNRLFSWNSNGTFNRELQVPPMPGFHFGFSAPKFSNDGNFIIVSYYMMSGLMQFHKLDTSDTPDMTVSHLTGHNAPVIKILWQSNHSDILAVLDLLGGICIWETTSRTPLHRYKAFNTRHHYIASFSPDGRFIAVAAQGEVKIVKFDTGDRVAVCEGIEYSGVLEWNPRGDKLAVVPLVTCVDFNVFNVDKINFGINLKGLSLMRVASLLEGNLVNGKDEAREFLENDENKIPKTLVDDVMKYLI